MVFYRLLNISYNYIDFKLDDTQSFESEEKEEDKIQNLVSFIQFIRYINKQ